MNGSYLIQQKHWLKSVLVSLSSLTYTLNYICFPLVYNIADIIAENETELSLFNRKEYEAFKANPEVSTFTTLYSLPTLCTSLQISSAWSCDYRVYLG